MRTSDEWELTDADDVADVMSWAESNSGGRRSVLYARVMTQEELG